MRKRIHFAAAAAVVGGALLFFGAPRAHAGGGPTYESGAAAPAPSATSSGPTSFSNPPGLPGTQQPPGVVAGITTGGVFKLTAGPTVYVLLDGQMRPLTSEAAFLAWGFKPSQIQTISASELSGRPMGTPLGIPDGTIVDSTGSGPYVIFRNMKNPAAPPALVSRLGLSVANAIRIPAQNLAAIPNGPNVK